MKVRNLPHIVFILISLLTANCQADDLIVGKWIQAELTKGGLGGIYIFYEDGKSSILFGAIVESKYKIDGNILVEIYQEINSEPQFTRHSFSIVNDKLILRLIDPKQTKDCKKELIMDRIGESPDKNSSVVGKWSYDHYTGGKALVEYTASGKTLFCVPMIYEIGNYILEKDTITIIREEKEPYVRQIKIEKDKLIFLKTNDIKEELYIRF